MSTARLMTASGLRAPAERHGGIAVARWLLIYLLLALLLAAASLLVGTSSVRTSLEWLRSPGALSLPAFVP